MVMDARPSAQRPSIGCGHEVPVSVPLPAVWDVGGWLMAGVIWGSAAPPPLPRVWAGGAVSLAPGSPPAPTRSPASHSLPTPQGGRRTYSVTGPTKYNAL